MLLASVADARKRFGYSDNPSINDALEGHLETAAQAVADRVRTAIERVDAVDTFFVKQSNIFNVTPSQAHSIRLRTLTATDNAQTELRLKRGFLDEAVTTVGVVAASLQSDLSDAAARVDLRAVNGSEDHVTVDAEAGIVRVHDYSLNNCYVEVTYKAGFLDDDGCPPVYIDTPNWLVQAGWLEAKLATSSDRIFGNEQISTTEQGRLESRLRNIIMRHARYNPMSWKPIACTATASLV